MVHPGDTAPGAQDPQVLARVNEPYDLPRACDGLSERTAIIGDKRNDENLIVAQLHRTLLHFHNAVCLQFPDISFEDARKTVMHHYQRILLNEFLPLIVGSQCVADALGELKYYRIGAGELAADPFIPLEFSGAAYRFGHSMVRSGYHFNRLFGPNLDFRLAFTFTGDGGFIDRPRYTSNWLLDWRQFFPGLGAEPQLAMAIGPAISDQLRIPPRGTPLAELNLKRGARHYQLPSGQAIAARMGLPPISVADMEAGPGGAVIKNFGIGRRTPLWYYLLREAELAAGGRHLGPIGGSIVAEVFIGLLRADPESVLSTSTPQTLPTAEGVFKIADLFRFIESQKGHGNIPGAGVINPLG